MLWRGLSSVAGIFEGLTDEKAAREHDDDSQWQIGGSAPLMVTLIVSRNPSPAEGRAYSEGGQRPRLEHSFTIDAEQT